MIKNFQLTADEMISERPFTNPAHIVNDQNSLCYMARQLCLLMEYPHFSGKPPHIIFFNRPNDSSYFHRIVLAQPELLQLQRPWAIVGFFGHKRENADSALVHEFDRILVAEIPEHHGLLSYSTMAFGDGNYANLVVFKDSASRKHWSTSRAHDQAVIRLSPQYYWTVSIYNGYLPYGIHDHDSLTLTRAKYFDYKSNPCWRAVREILN